MTISQVYTRKNSRKLKQFYPKIKIMSSTYIKKEKKILKNWITKYSCQEYNLLGTIVQKVRYFELAAE